MTEFSRSVAGNYATTIMAVAVATVLQALAIRYNGADLPLVLYYPLLACVAWAVSFRFGLLATALSGALVWLLFLSDPSASTLSLSQRLARLAAFLVVGAFVCAIAAALRRMRVARDGQRRSAAFAQLHHAALLQSLPCAVVASDLHGRLTYMNAAAARLVGCADADPAGRPARDVLQLRDRAGRPVPVTPLERALERGAADTVSEQHWVHVGGAAPLPVVGTAAPLRDAGGNVDGAVMLLHDARAERADADECRMLRAVVDASPDAIVGIGMDRRIVSWNPAARRMFGYAERDVLGRDIALLVAQRWLRRHPALAALGERRAAPRPFDMLCVRRDGTRFRATVSACPVPGEARETIRVSLTLRSADEQHRRERRTQRSLRGARDAQQQADTSNRLKDELLATVSHELRTPLNVIYGWIEVLRNSSDAGLHQQAIDAIDRSARSLTRMVGDILDMSSLATGKLRLDTMPVDLARVFNEVVDGFRTPAAIAGIVLESDCAPTECVVSGDGERLRQMLSNLLSNALKFTPRGGRVTASLARADDQAVLSVADTGQGIAPEFVPHVFEAFRRADDSPASSRRGLGLGLSIVRHIAELHDGTVAVHSAGNNCGTTFTVRLPAIWRATDLPVPDSGHAADGPALDAQRILLVDDDATTRASLAAALTTLGAEVSVASSGREALAMAARVNPTVVLSDLAMPDGDGFWLLDALRRQPPGAAHAPDVRVLAVTAHAGRLDERRARAAGFDDFLSKPIDLQQLAQAISRATALR